MENMRKTLISALVLLAGTTLTAADSGTYPLKPAPKGWPDQVKTVMYPAGVDDSLQPMLIRVAKSKAKRPLLVGLHTWSGNYAQGGGETVYARWCIQHDWYFIHPDFRGPNWTPDACGSEKVVRDIVDAVNFMKKHYAVDPDRIYLVGVSGGGCCALLMAGRAPEIWAGVSAWAPISDLQAWWKQKRFGNDSMYADHIEKAVGGRPDQAREAAEECARRSALTYLNRASAVNLDINAGIFDGHNGGSVPFTHSLYAYNRVVPEEDRLPESFIETFYRKQSLPETVAEAQPDPLYGSKKVIYRKVSGNTRVSIFQGGHEIVHRAALNWLAAQRKGKAANWNLTGHDQLYTRQNESASGK